MATRRLTLDAPRCLALPVCAGLLVALLCPWLSETAVTRGLHGTLRLHQVMSGWQSLTVSAVVAVVVALAVPAVLLGGAARPRAGARRRLEGTIVAAGGAVTVISTVWTLAAHEGSHATGPATVHDAVGWGVVLALACALALVALGGWILRAAPADSPARAAARRGSAATRPPLRTGATRTRTARSPRR